MNKQVELLQQQRWSMLSNPYDGPLGPLSQVTEMELILHLFFIESVTEGQQLSEAEMKQCRGRFVRFCRTQWENRNIN